MSQVYHCTRCGHVAQLLAIAMDPRYPLGRCLNQSRSCGQVAVLPEGPRWEQHQRDRQRAGMRKRHNTVHLSASGHLVAACPLCQELLDSRRAPRATSTV